jgi:hypothetical protein
VRYRKHETRCERQKRKVAIPSRLVRSPYQTVESLRQIQQEIRPASGNRETRHGCRSRVARRLRPTRLDAAFISTLLVATSSQVLVTSMTSYAMTGHLTLNLIWLWLFLRDDKIGHGARSIRDGSRIARELTTGVILTLAAMFILMPDQGLGWGYRYLHGLIGSLSLLAGYGWIALSARATRDEMAASWTMLTIGSAVAWLILLPVHAKHAHEFAMPYVRAADAIGHAATDLVVIDKSELLFAEDFVRNDPFLGNRPKVLDLTFLDEAKLADLCARYSISLFGHPQALAFGIPLNDDATKFDDEVRARLRAAMARLSCGVDMAVSANKDTRF